MAPEDFTQSPYPSDFIARLAETDRQDFLQLAVQYQANKEELIFHAGSPGNHVYCLQSGRVKVYSISSNGKEVVLWSCYPGEIFGLAEVCHGGGRQVYAEACENSVVLRIRQDNFKAFLAAHPAASLLVNDVLACRLRNLGNLIQSLVASDVNERVAQLIVRMAASNGRRAANGDIHLDVRLTHQEMANMVGTTRQSVTSALNLLRRQGVLEFDANHHMLVHTNTLLTQAGISVTPTSPAPLS
jgi:CRP/FNR family transcriptional regulator, cyclic AMP receptor protein